MLYGRHVTHAFSRGPLIKEFRVRVRASLVEIYVGWSGNGTGFKGPMLQFKRF